MAKEAFEKLQADDILRFMIIGDKKSVFEVCNNLAKQQSLNKLGIALKNNAIDFEVVFEDEWERRLNELFEN